MQLRLLTILRSSSSVINQFEQNKEVRDKLLDYLLSLEIFTKEYDMDEINSELLKILMDNRVSCFCTDLFIKKDQNSENYWENLKSIDPNVCQFLNIFLFKKFILGIKNELTNGLQFVISIPFDVWSYFYAEVTLSKTDNYKRFLKELSKWLDVNYLKNFTFVEFENDSVLISVEKECYENFLIKFLGIKIF